LLTRERFHRETLRAPVRALELTVTTLESESVPVSDLFQPNGGMFIENWPQFAARLRARLGDDALRVIATNADHCPERATRWDSWSDTPLPKRRTQEVPTGASAQRPLWLTRRPIPLCERNGRLDWCGGLVVGAERERIESGWWQSESVARDYFVAIDPHGMRWWVYKELSGQRAWYLHGIF
jgi:protein ImuB